MLKEKETEYLLKIEELKLDNEKMISNIKKTMEEKVIIYETRIKEMNELHLSDVSKLQIKFDKERIDITNSFEFKIKNLNNTIADMIEKLKNFGQNNNEKVTRNNCKDAICREDTRRRTTKSFEEQQDCK